jgi:hypothetical protein
MHAREEEQEDTYRYRSCGIVVSSSGGESRSLLIYLQYNYVDIPSQKAFTLNLGDSSHFQIK